MEANLRDMSCPEINKSEIGHPHRQCFKFNSSTLQRPITMQSHRNLIALIREH